jgi:hypothetical protein
MWTIFPQKEFDLLEDDEALPATAERKPAITSVLFLILMGILPLGLPAVLIYAGGGSPSLITAGALLVCLVLTFSAFLLARSHRRYVFHRSGVEYHHKGPIIGKHWSEDLSAYRGIAGKTIQVAHYRHTETFYRVVLVHCTDRSRDLTLCQSKSQYQERNRREAYARLFDLPALTATDEGWMERDPEDLDKSVRQQAAEGALALDTDIGEPPAGWRLNVRVEGETLILQARYRVMLAATGVLALIIGIAFVSAAAGELGSGADAGDWKGLLLGLVAFLFGAGLLSTLIMKEELVVSPSELRKRLRAPWGTLGPDLPVSADAVEEVSIVDNPHGTGGKVVQIAGDFGALHYGAGLNAKQRRWVRDGILVVISQETRE